jgi:predicted transcriptional regulator
MYEEKLKELEKQKEMAKELFLKCQGAIEVIKQLREEEKDATKKPEAKSK